MSSPFLPVFYSNALLDAAEMLPRVTKPDVTQREMLTFCQHRRVAGLCALFLEGSPEIFYQELHKSGRAYLYFLQQKNETDIVTSQAAPFFDALAANDLDCARAIAENTRPTWHTDEEYEDDFLYVFFLMKHFFLNGSEAECQALLARYETVLEGTSDVRLALCHAFFQKDAALFDEALHHFLLEHETYYKKLLDDESLPLEIAATEANLSVEGAALVRLAEMKGVSTQQNYLFIPSTVRKTPSMAFDPDAWKRPS